MEASMQPSAESSASATVPPTSHHLRHHVRNKKGSDPFLALADEDLKLSDLPSPSSGSGTEDSHSDSLFMDLLITPVTMISFLLSLFLVDRQQRQWRMSQHSTGSESIWSRFTAWRSPEPYQDSRDATWKHSSNTPAQGGSAVPFSGWYRRKKHRAMAKMEMSDAFEMRQRVLLALFVWIVLGFFALMYASRRMYAWMSRA